MELIRIKIPKSKLLQMPEAERVFLVQVGNVLNEISMLEKIGYFSANPSMTADPIARSAQIAQALFLTRMLAGKLFEGWQFLHKHFFGARLCKEYHPKLTDVGKKALNELKSYFDRSNLVCSIRNNYAFHYSPQGSEAIGKLIDSAADSEVFELYFSRGHGNCFYSMSHVLLNLAVLNSIDSSDVGKAIDVGKAMDKLLRDIYRITGLFLDFLGDCLMVMVKEHIGFDHEEVAMPNSPNIADVTLPYFVEGQLWRESGDNM